MMKIGSDDWLTFVQDAAAQLGINVHHRQSEQFGRHAQWLLEWNRKINLTAITDPQEVAIKHFVDAIAPLHHIPDNGHLLDIGTGGGFPGIPLKIMRPEQNMTLIDSVRKKINFVRHVIRQMPLEGVKALHTRAEALADILPSADKFDIIVCRALTDPHAALVLSGPLLAPRGMVVLYRGPGEPSDTDPDQRQSIVVGGVDYQASSITYTLPSSNFSRRVFLIQNRD